MNISAAGRLAAALIPTVLALKSDHPLLVIGEVICASFLLFVGLVALSREDGR